MAIAFDDKGGDLFAKTTGEIGGTGRVLGIFLDDKLISSPSVGPEFQGKGITGNRAVITGNFTLDSATELALQLRAGALPVPVEIVENRTVGASLGAESILSSIYAGVAGLLLVLVFMVLYYRILGVVADMFRAGTTAFPTTPFAADQNSWRNPAVTSKSGKNL